MINAGATFERLVADFCERNWTANHVKTNHKIDGREVDILIESNNELVIVECTTERGKKKAEYDILKIREVRRALVGDAMIKSVRGYFITPDSPSPDVHKVAEENGEWIEACSFPAFINKYNSSSTYLIERTKRPFGSVRNPATDKPELARERYVSVPLKTAGTNRDLSLDRIVSDIVAQTAVKLILTGDFGIGKSMTFRELFFRLSEQYAAGKTYRFPLYINLSDGLFRSSDGADDLIEQHAKDVGMKSQRDSLVHAWQSDCCVLLLDGFDEIARHGFQKLATSSHHVRRSSCLIIKKIVEESPSNTPIFICGRQSYFANFDEMRECLGAQRSFDHVSLDDLDELEVKQLFQKILPANRASPVIFGWLPQRPLLLSYLYFKLGEELRSTQQTYAGVAPGVGWNHLLDRLSHRETRVAEDASPSDIRRLVERVALYARTNLTEPGRVTGMQVAQAFRDTLEMEPDQSVQQVLLRLPGLRAGGANEDRGFVDSNLFEAAQAGSIAELVGILGARDDGLLRSDRVRLLLGLLRKTQTVIPSLTAQVAVAILMERGELGILGIALREALSMAELNEGNAVGDLFMCALERPDIGFRDDLKSITFRNSAFSELEVTNEAAGGRQIIFQDCLIDDLELTIDDELLPNLRFSGTEVARLTCSSRAESCLTSIGLGESVSQITTFDATNSDILTIETTRQSKAVKIILRKLFRKHNAGLPKAEFLRGIGELRPDLIERCLLALLKHRLAYVVGNPELTSSVWYPNRAHSKRATVLINASATSGDIVLDELLSA